MARGCRALNRDFAYETYAAEAGRCGVTDAIHMEVDVARGDIEAETRNVDELARGPGSLLRGAISACRPEDDGFPAFLERQVADPFVKGFRRVLHVVAGRRQRVATFRANVQASRRLRRGRSISACARPDRQGDRAGRPRAGRSSSCSTIAACRRSRSAPSIRGARKSSEIARRPNVAVKISGVVAYAEARPGPSTTSAPMSNMRSKASAGIASSGAATGRCAR